MKGTLLQKVYYVNTYLFSKIWYVAQCFKIEKRVLDNIVVKALQFIYAGENERPVRTLNFRDKSVGGLGLVNPIMKAKALLIKSMHKEFVKKGCDISNTETYEDIYGYVDEMVEMIKAGVSLDTTRFSYSYLNESLVCRNNSVIPSRSEKRAHNIRWSTAWTNWRDLRGVDAHECIFAWKLQQDMLPLGSRLHRPNAEKRCLTEIGRGEICQEIETREHVFLKCVRVKESIESFKGIITEYLGRDIEYNNIIYLAFNHRNKQRLRSAIWIAVKVMYLIYNNRMMNKSQLLKELVKEIDWNLEQNRKIGSRKDMLILGSIIKNYI